MASEVKPSSNDKVDQSSTQEEHPTEHVSNPNSNNHDSILRKATVEPTAPGADKTEQPPTPFTVPNSTYASLVANPYGNDPASHSLPDTQWTQDAFPPQAHHDADSASISRNTPPGPANAYSGGTSGRHPNLLQWRPQPASYPASEAAGENLFQRDKKWFRTRRIQRDPAQPKQRPARPRKMDARDKWLMVIPLLGLALGAFIAAILVWDGIRSVSNFKYCSVLDDDFSHGLRSDVWTHEVQVGGFGNGQFEQTTTSPENSFVQNNLLHLKPTLQNATLIETDGAVLDLRGHGCTGSHWHDCIASTNATNGSIINPVRSARLTTKRHATIRYGRVEVEAKLPRGDWLWPAIWMLPRDSVYGAWPRSGELDIAQSRGNDFSYPLGGNDIVSSSLHFGPDAENDGWWRNYVTRRASHTTFSDGFNTFGVEWTPKYIFTYINTRLVQTLYHPLTTPLWSPSRFPLVTTNGSRLSNPWATSTHPNQAPFDQPFYLVLSLGVGARNGWFADSVGGKPWADASEAAAREFWERRRVWGRSWGMMMRGSGEEEDGEGGGLVGDGREEMRVRRVRMWQQEGFEGCRVGEGKSVF